ncbi:serine/threonine-protein kinase [Saccharopolyspora sp. 5N708]|uniref:serine/threonine-protein kinase n=1 Tax=Saccharopolyspora sp. 5N708 TaxID=3457424 RepID=UPI003FD64CA0
MQALDEADPRRIGDYAVLRRLGRGAMGTVYLGRSPGGRFVAVKVVRAELVADDRFRARFRREVEMARRVGGFWTAVVVDADPDAAQPWLATEYVAGPSLHHAVTMQGPLPEPAALRLVAGLAEALGAIHRAGLVHRDLKPYNVLLGGDGPRLIDFGIARAVHNTALTATGEFVGTPGFLSPEQVSGDPIGPASDVFGLGAVLVFATTGTGPYGTGDTDTAVLLHRVAHGEPELGGTPPAVRELASACLRRDPADRPTTAQVLERAGGATAARSTLWLPPPVQTLVAQHQTWLSTVTGDEIVGDTAKSRHEVSSESGDVTTFRTSRLPAVLWSGASATAAIMVSGLGNPAFPPPVRLSGVLATTLCCALAGFWLVMALRPRHVLRISAAGIEVAQRRRRHPQLAWRDIARTRVVAARGKGLVVWMRSQTANPAERAFASYHDEVRIYPLRGTRRGRNHEMRELQAALAWYGQQTYDSNL